MNDDRIKKDFTVLEHNIVDVIKEEQIKLGYQEEVIRLYYPLQSINRLLKSELSAKEMQKELSEYFESAQTVLGKVWVSHKEERFCFLIPKDGVAYVHEHTGENEFIREFIRTIEKPHCTIEALSAVFYRHSQKVHFEEVSHGEFNYLIYFEDGSPDDYRYCITDEGCHMIYHRFTVDDYKDFEF